MFIRLTGSYVVSVIWGFYIIVEDYFIGLRVSSREQRSVACNGDSPPRFLCRLPPLSHTLPRCNAQQSTTGRTMDFRKC